MNRKSIKILSSLCIVLVLFMATSCTKSHNYSSNTTTMEKSSTQFVKLQSAVTDGTTMLSSETTTNTTTTKKSLPTVTTVTSTISSTEKEKTEETKKKTTTTTKKQTTTSKKHTTTTKKTTTTTTTSTKIIGKQLKIDDKNVVYGTTFNNEAKEVINKYRTSEGKKPLAIDSNMAKLAGIRAIELSSSFSHTRPNGGKSYSVYEEYSITEPYYVGENIAIATRFEDAADIISVWMDSPEHKKIILKEKFNRFGLAMYTAPNGKMYAAMLLGS